MPLLPTALLLPLSSALRPAQQYVGARPTQQQMRRETALSSTAAGASSSSRRRIATTRSPRPHGRCALRWKQVSRDKQSSCIPLPPETSSRGLDPWPAPAADRRVRPTSSWCLRKAVKGGSEDKRSSCPGTTAAFSFTASETPADDAMMILQPGAETFDDRASSTEL